METKRISRWKRHWKLISGGYFFLLFASHLFIFFQKDEPGKAPENYVTTDEGLILAYAEWGKREGIPLILSHGSPGGGGSDFERFARELAKARWVIAPDRWGFGQSSQSVPDYSFVADADAISFLMSELQIEKADAMGWSYGGGVVMELAARHPDSVRSLGLLGAIGIQEGEGSGNYYVEQVKYFLMKAVTVGVPEVIPHFGLAGPRSTRVAFARDFQDADQRPIRGIMESMEKPVLILQGKDDPMVPAWVAEEHHRLLSNSRLEILKGSHFFPMGGEGMASAVEDVNDFLTAVANGEDVRGANYETTRTNMKALWSGGPSLRGWKPWWLVMIVGASLSWWFPRVTVFLVGLGGALLLFDGLLALAAVGLLLLGKKVFRKGSPAKTSLWKKVVLLVDFIAGSVLGGILLGLG